MAKAKRKEKQTVTEIPQPSAAFRHGQEIARKEIHSHFARLQRQSSLAGKTNIGVLLDADTYRAFRVYCAAHDERPGTMLTWMINDLLKKEAVR